MERSTIAKEKNTKSNIPRPDRILTLLKLLTSYLKAFIHTKKQAILAYLPCLLIYKHISSSVAINEAAHTLNAEHIFHSKGKGKRREKKKAY